MNDKIKVIVVTHKEYEMPEDRMYLPVWVGNKVSPPNDSFQRDNEGDNISERNNQYSELTALYWAWKNLESDYIGMSHYRRHVSMKKTKSLEGILSEQQALELLKSHRVLVVQKRIYPETIKQHYINCHKNQKEIAGKQVDILDETIGDMFPEYQESFHRVMNKHSAHMFNMFIMSKEDLNAYCEWLFSILFETEKRIEKAGVKQDRLMGSLSEFLLDTWLTQNDIKAYELKLYQTEMSFWKSVKRFLYRRFFEK